MADDAPTISRTDFDRLIATAMKLDQESGERLRAEEARAIALELGITPEAWQAALDAQEARVAVERTAVARKTFRVRLRTLILAGVATGIGSGAFGGSFGGDGVLWLGAATLGAVTAWGVHTLRRHGARQMHIELATTWLSILVGLFIGLKQFHSDPIVAVLTGWISSIALIVLIERARRRMASTSPMVRSTSG